MSSPSSAPQQETPRDPGAVAGWARGNAANWDDEDPLPRRLSAQEAEAFRDQRNAPSPWRVVLVQIEAGAVLSLLFGLLSGLPALWSALFGAATAVVPGALMARGATRMADVKSPLATALALLGWESAKIVCSVAMLVLGLLKLHLQGGPLLVTLGGCLVVYWVALAWRSR
jgi:ATP synthase protein I